jgi:Family of unknown function (DUF6502)
VSASEQEASERGAFLDAIEELLRPLMPVVLSYGVTPNDVGQVLRTLYLETLAARLREQGRPPSVSRLALMAGLTRGEVEALLARQTQRHQQRNRSTHKLDQLSGLLAMWHDDSRFGTPYGAPLDLSLQPERNFKTFKELIDAGAPGSDPSLVLDELLAAGCVEVHANKFVRCISRTYVPSGVDVSRIARLGRYVGALNSNFAHNLLRKPDQPAYFERVLTTVEPVAPAFREKVLGHLHSVALPFLEQMDRWLEAEETEARDPAGMRCGVCMFFFEERPAASNGDANLPLANAS